MNYYAPTFVGTAMTLLCGVFDSSGFYFNVEKADYDWW